MEKKYKVITDFGRNLVYIEKFNSLKDAIQIFDMSIKDDACYVYLLEILMSYSSGDSCEKVLSFFKHE